MKLNLNKKLVTHCDPSKLLRTLSFFLCLFVAMGTVCHSASAQELICPPVDVVFTVDTSGSMNDEALALCDSISAVQADLLAQGLVSQTHILGITQAGGGDFSCLTDHVANLLGSDVPGDGGACTGPLDQSESWGQAISVVSNFFPWTLGGVRVIVPVSDEGACKGNSCEDPGEDRDAITNAIIQAKANNVFVSPISGTGSNQCVIDLSSDIALATGGTAFISTDPMLDLAGAINQLIVNACIASTPPPPPSTNCVETNSFDELLALDGAALEQETIVKRLARILKRRGGKKKDVNALRSSANALYVSAWNATWKYPTTTLSCEEHVECVIASLSEPVAEILAINQELADLAVMAEQMIKKVSNNGAGKSVKNKVARSMTLLAETEAALGGLPQQETSCSPEVLINLS